MFKRNPERLLALSEQLLTRATQLDREGKFASATIERKRAAKLVEAAHKAAAKA